ncbi:carboxymuconolactone decarboxylase family protein [Methylobacterium terrae]|nr:carboxymuconolactone decarboxylase family protein [Methylobacterium terrae]
MEKVDDAHYAAPVAPAEVAAPSTQAVAPALARYTEGTLLGEVWTRPGLSPRDRSLVTLAALIARGQTVELPFHVGRALDNGVTPGEIAETVTHLAFYAGWGSADAALPALRAAFAQRGIGADRLPEAVPAQPLPLDQAAESRRAARVEAEFGTVSPNLVKDTTEILFRDLWLRPGLAPRDRSLVTVSALVANSQVAQMPYHLDRAMDAGLTKEQAGEVIAHLAYYAGWPSAFSALPVARSVFEARNSEERAK